MALPSSIIRRGNRASQPAANAVAAGTLYCVTNEGDIIERSTGAAWESYSPTGSSFGTVTNTGNLTANRLILGNGGVDVTALGSLGTTTTVLHGNAAGAPTFGAVSLTADVTGVLPVANGGVLIKGTPVALTDAQIKALPTTPVQILAAPGASITNWPVFWIVKTNTSAGAYTNINAGAYAWVRSSVGTNPVLSRYMPNDAGSTPVLGVLNSILGTAASFTFMLLPFDYETDPLSSEWGNIPGLVITGDVENGAQQVTMDNGGSGNLTGGNAANTWTFTPYYVPIP